MIPLRKDYTFSNVEIDDTRRRKSYEIFKLYTILNYLLIFVIIVMITRMYINGQEFQLQMDKVNYSIVQLTRKYDELNRNININRSCSHKIYFYNFNQIQSSDRKLFNLSEIYTSDDDSNIASLMKSEYNSIVDFNKIRYFLCNLSALQISEIQNLVTTKDEETDILNSQKKPRIKRLQRNIRKSEKEQQNKKRSKRSEDVYLQKLDYPLLASFVGRIPEQYSETIDKIGPWKQNTEMSNPFNFNMFRLVDLNMSIKVAIGGLYMISVQIFYYGDPNKYSYYVYLNSDDWSNTKQLVTCVTVSSEVTGSKTCYTSIIVHLKKGDELSVYQTEKNRLINLREGFSHIQLLLLAKDEKEII